MLNILKLLILIMFLSFDLNAQLANEYSNWVFCDNYKLNFDLLNNNVTLKRIDFQNPVACSNISNKSGKLLLTSIYNKISSYLNDTIVDNHSVSNLIWYGSNQDLGNIILPLLSKENRYIVFHTVDSTWNRFDNTFLKYTIIDVDTNKFIKIISENIVRYNVRDQIASYFNNQDSSFTIVVTNWPRDTIYSYKCNKYGDVSYLNKSSKYVYYAKDTDGDIIKDGIPISLKISPNGKYIAAVCISEDFCNLIQFEPETGLFGNSIILKYEGNSQNTIYFGSNSCEFSSNSKYLYLINALENNICQYNISKFINSNINNSKVVIKNDSNIYYHKMLLGMNGKIYIRALVYSNLIPYQSFSIIENSNILLNESNISHKQLFYDPLPKSYMLPNIPANAYYQKFNTKSITTNSPVCYLDTIRFNATFDEDTSKIDCYWTGPNGFAANAKNPKFVYNAEIQNGWYYLRAVHNVSDFENIDSVLVQNNPINKIKIQHNKALNLCQGDTVKLYTNIVSPEVEWYVNNNFAKKSTDLYIDSSCKVNVKFIDNAGCISYDTVNINVNPKVKIEYFGNLSICQGDSVKLFIKDKLASLDYEWIVNNAIIIADTIVAKVPQKYRLIARNKTLNGCTDSTEIEVLEQAKEKLVINGTKTFCEGDSTKLEISKPFPRVQFEWSTGEKANRVMVNKAGTYWCRAINNNCLTADTIQIAVNPKPVISITGETTICKNAIGVLTLNGTYTSCTWSGGETTPSITITKDGLYFVEAENEFGCRATKQIEVKEISNNIDLSSFQDIDFGKIKINESITKELDLNGINPSNIKLLNNKEFTFIRNGNKLEITFKATKKGISEDSLFIAIDEPCQETIALKLKAEAEGEQIITLKVADIEVLAGDISVPLPITYKLNENVVLPQTFTWTAKLRYKTAIYYPDLSGDVKSANRSIEVKLSGIKTLTKKEDTLTIIRGKTFLADTIYTKVDFTEITVNPDLTINKEDGSIKIVGLCAPNLRQIEFFTPPTLTIKPNPSNGEVDIEFTSDENVETILKLYNSAGAEVLSDVKDKKSKTINFQYDKLVLPIGIYQVQIEQFGKIVATNKLLIEK